MIPAVKVCGVCSPEDAVLIAEEGADYLGVILDLGRMRTQSTTSAAAILRAATGPRYVGVFVDPEPEVVHSQAERLGLDVIQLHGSEGPELVESLNSSGHRVWKALRPRDLDEFLEGLERYAEIVDAILLDGWSPAGPGGTGTPFPWREVARAREQIPEGTGLVIAGGLNPTNVADAIEILRPDVVDVSSGVESAPKVKDPDLVEAFISKVRIGRRVT